MKEPCLGEALLKLFIIFTFLLTNNFHNNFPKNFLQSTQTDCKLFRSFTRKLTNYFSHFIQNRELCLHSEREKIINQWQTIINLLENKLLLTLKYYQLRSLLFIREWHHCETPASDAVAATIRAEYNVHFECGYY